MEKVFEKYNVACNTPTDIFQHLPTIKRYSEQCETICEMGVRYVVSTWAMLMAKPKKLISVDITYRDEVAECKEICKEYGLNWEYVLESSLTYDMPNVDMLFIDTIHTYKQLDGELKKHGNNVNKYIVFHDTESYRDIGEDSYHAINNPNPIGTGIWRAIEEFMAANPHWVIAEHFSNNNGLTILQRK